MKNLIEKEIFPKVYACINKNEKIRMESSSGGVFTLLAEKILQEDGIVFGATFNSNLDVEHIGIENAEDLKLLRGSKYVQSNIKSAFKLAEDYLKNGRKVLFTGTPCQIETLKLFLKKDYDNLYTQDLICHGIPVKKVWDKYLQENQVLEKIKKFSFRNKENKGWNKYQILIEYENFKKYINHNDDIYMKIFLSDIALRESCYNCKYKKKHRNSDITLADFWGIEEVAPEMNDEKGTSLVFIHSSKGENLFDNIKENLILKEVDFEQSVANNPSMLKSAERPLSRENFIQDLDKYTLEDLYKKYLYEEN